MYPEEFIPALAEPCISAESVMKAIAEIAAAWWVHDR